MTALVWEDSGGALNPRMNDAETFLAIARIGYPTSFRNSYSVPKCHICVSTRFDIPSLSGMQWPPLRALLRPRVIFAIAFFVRLLAIPLSVVRINPYAQADATGFSVAASIIARHFLTGTVSFATRYNDIYEIWGGMLSPFWLLPVGGPILARILLALLGAVAVYNTVLITRRLSTPVAGLVAGVPLAIYPSIVLVQSSLLREGAILFAITTAARLLLIVSERRAPLTDGERSRPQRIVLAALAVALLAFAAVLRNDNVPLYALAVAGGAIAYYWDTLVGKATAALAAIAGFMGIYVFRGLALDRFNLYREKRSRGRAAYLGDVRFDGLVDLLSFSPLGSIYFLFAPFPWMVGSVLDIPVLGEGLGNIAYALAAVAGIVVAFKRDRVATIGLGLYFFAGVALYGLGTANYGTGVRHRQMFLWVLFIFGAVGAQWLWTQYTRPSDLNRA